MGCGMVSRCDDSPPSRSTCWFPTGARPTPATPAASSGGSASTTPFRTVAGRKVGGGGWWKRNATSTGRRPCVPSRRSSGSLGSGSRRGGDGCCDAGTVWRSFVGCWRRQTRLGGDVVDHHRPEAVARPNRRAALVATHPVRDRDGGHLGDTGSRLAAAAALLDPRCGAEPGGQFNRRHPSSLP